MAYDFLGTIPSLEAFEELEEFITIESKNLEKRITHLIAERKRHLEVLDKILQADINLRSEYKKSVRPDRLWITKSRTRPVERVVTNDTVNAVGVANLKESFIDTIKVKRENNEYKIKRLRDLEEQIYKEVKKLTDMKENYQTYLSKIKARFSLKDFPENQVSKSQDQVEIDKNMTAIPVDKGIVVENGKTYYLVTSINSQFKKISFDGQNPPIREGDVITLSGGNNNGVKTVMSIDTDRTVIVYEDLSDESNSKTRVEIKY